MFTFLILLVVFSCNSKVNNSSNDTKGKLISQKKYIELTVDDKTATYSRYFFHEKFEDKDYLLLYNEPITQIQFYSLDEKKLKATIDLQMEGANGVGKVGGIKALSLDSILVLDQRNFTINIVNDRSEVIEKWDFYSKAQKVGLQQIQSWSRSQNQIDVYQGELYFTQKLSGNWNNISASQKKATKLAATLNLINNELRKLPLDFPVNYWEKNKSVDPVFSRLHNSGSFIYTFPIDDYLYVTNNLHEKWEKYLAKSKYVDVNHDFAKVEATYEEIVRYHIESPRYLNILFDPYKKYYYRFVYLGREFDKDRDLNTKIHINSPISIIILDDEFNVLGEQKLLDKKYVHEMAFVNKEGLWISTNHPLNEEAPENTMRFELFRFERFK